MASHIKLPRPSIVEIKRRECPTCTKPRFFVEWFEDWYGWYFTCLKCGERFTSEEGRMERPFARGWREDSVRRIKKFYRKWRPK